MFFFSFVLFFYSIFGLLKGKGFLKYYPERIVFNKENKSITIEHTLSAQKKLILPYSHFKGLEVSHVRRSTGKRSYIEYYIVLKFKNGSEWALKEYRNEEKAYKDLASLQNYFLLHEKPYRLTKDFSIKSDTFNLICEHNTLTCYWKDKSPRHNYFTLIISLVFMIFLNSIVYYFLWDKTFPSFEEQFPFYIVGGIINLVMVFLFLQALIHIIKSEYLINKILLQESLFKYKNKSIPFANIKDCYFSYYPTNNSNDIHLVSDFVYSETYLGNTNLKNINTKDNHLCTISFIKISPLDVLSLNLALQSILKGE